nr:MAG: protein of unknown function DUF1978 [Sanya bunya-like virus 5]
MKNFKTYRGNSQINFTGPLALLERIPFDESESFQSFDMNYDTVMQCSWNAAKAYSSNELPSINQVRMIFPDQPQTAISALLSSGIVLGIVKNGIVLKPISREPDFYLDYGDFTAKAMYPKRRGNTELKKLSNGALIYWPIPAEQTHTATSETPSLFLGNFRGNPISAPVYKAPQVSCVDQEIEFFEIKSDILLDQVEFPQNEFYLSDSGGAGDCFIKALNYSLSEYYPDMIRHNPSNWYKLFNLPVNTYIEYEQILALSSYYSANLIISRSFNGEIWFQSFGHPDFDKFLYFYNEYDIHYYSWFNFAPEMTGDDQSSEDELEVTQHPSNGVCALPPHASPEVLYAFLLESNYFIYTDNGTVLSTYNNVHMAVNNLLSEINTAGKYLPSYFIKMYYKFRHNVFSQLVKTSIGIENQPFGTDASLRKWIDSDKTPDVIWESEGKIVLMELTVGNDYERVDFLKGGGYTMVKYTDQAKQISEKTGKLCYPLIIPAILKERNIEEIRDIISTHFPGSEIEIEELKYFFDIALDNFSLFGENASVSMAEENEVYEPLRFPDLPEYERPEIKKVYSLSSEFVCSFFDNRDRLKMTCYKLEDQYFDPRCSFYYETESHRFSVRYDKSSKLTATELRALLHTSSLGNILPILKVNRKGKPLSLDALRGTMPVMCDFKEKKEQSTHLKYQNTMENYFEMTFSNYDDGYGTPTKYSPSDQLDMGNWGPVAFGPNYYAQLLEVSHERLHERDVKKKMLASNDMSPLQIQEAVQDFTEAQEQANQIDYLMSPKQTFQFPLLSSPAKKVGLNDLNLEMMEYYKKVSNKTYTKAILTKAIDGSFSEITSTIVADETREFRKLLSDKNSAYYQAVSERFGGKKYRDLTQEERDNVSKEKRDLDEARKLYKNSLSKAGSSTRERMVKIRCSKNQAIYHEWKAEMSHFQRSGAQFKGLGGLSDNLVSLTENYFKELSDRMFEPDFHSMKLRSIYDDVRGPGPDFLTDEKNKYTARWNEFYNMLSGTLYDQLAYFISSLCKSLFKESTRTYNNDYVKVENLGLSNVILLIRGGSKIYKHQTSKLFKVIFMADHRDAMFTGYKENPDFECYTREEGVLIATPWMQLHQDSMLDGITFRHRSFMSLYVNHTRAGYSLSEPVSRFNFLPVMLFLHNRRKTETFMHNCRYIIVNTLGKYANLKAIIKSFAGFNYTYFDAWLKSCISRKYFQFSTKLMRLREMAKSNADSAIKIAELEDLWFGEPISNAEQLTSFIYSTYMMTKAPVTSSVEQSNNLWEILEDVWLFESKHSSVNKMDDKSLRFSVLDQDCTVYDDDFKYDPVFSQYLGHYTAGFLLKAMGHSKIRQTWISIKNSPVDSIANSKGLRGWNNKNFFNKKSYEIVYEKVEEMLASKDLNIRSMIDDYMSGDPLSSTYAVIADRETFSKKEKTLDDLVFHVVQKIQRGGGREIFCMDYDTKARQNPLEKFFKSLCKAMPNEFISVPSNKRSGLIHTDFFEKGPGSWVKNIVRWVLDCRRWAPHSVFQKYVHFIHGMAPVLPPDFLNEFNTFALKMMSKRFYTREHVLQKMRNNEKFKKYEGFFKKDDPFRSKDGYYFHVKFSFVMGIFNYLSSLMHAGNQLLASELIRDYCLANKLGLVHLEPKCHSDDSVVSSHHESSDSIKPSVILYDWWLKGANHMLSVKKSQVNENVYLEFLSVLYLFDRLLPVIPKFAATIPFQPSDSGYASDVSFAVTQTIELLSQGGTFEEAFLMMKLTENMIQGIYHMEPIDDVPFNFMGRIDCHPVELLLSGSDCEMYKYLKFRPKKTKGLIRVLQTGGYIDENDTGTLTLKWDMGSRLSPSLRSKFQRLTSDCESMKLGKWALENTKLGNQYLNLVWFCGKLSDPKYYASLVHEPAARRFSRIFGAAAHRNIVKKNGELMPVANFIVTIQAMGDFPEEVDELDLPFYKTIEVLNEELGDFLEAVSDVEIIEELPNNLKDKPVTIVAKDPYLGQSKISPAEYVIYMKEREMIPLLGKIKDFTRESVKISERIRTMGIDPQTLQSEDLFKMATKMLGKDNKVYKMVSCTTSSNRYITQYSHLIHLIETNSIRHVKYRCKYKRANVIDWGRKLMKGRIPADVSTAMRHFWALRCIERYGVQSYDIFKENPNDLYEKSLKTVPREWASIIASTEKNSDTPLVSRYYWCHWPKEQVKINRIWYGKGNCIINIPETMLKFEILNGMITEVYFNVSSTAVFSVPSSWYIKALVSQEGVNMEMVLPEYGDPACLYFGYADQTGLYGIGPPHLFTNIFLNTSISEVISSNFMHLSIKPKQERGHWLYETDGRRFKVYFFTPEDDNIMVSLSEYVDHDKVKSLMKDPKIKKFCTDFALQHGLSYSYKLDSLIDNISRSKVYKILHNSSHFAKIAEDRSCEEDDSLIEVFSEWKKNHPEFGFPTISELEELLKSEDIPPLPLSVQQLLYKMGKNDLPDNLKQDIIYKVFNLQGEERTKYIHGISLQYGGDMSANMIALSLKTKRLLATCKFLSNQSLRVATPVIKCLVSAVETGNVYSGSLNRMLIELKRSLKREYSAHELLKMMSARAVVDCMTMLDRSAYSKSTTKFFSVIEDLLDGGLISEFALQTETDPLLRATDFSLTKEEFMGFLIDIFDSITFLDWGLGSGSVNDMSIIGENGRLSNELSYFRGSLTRVKINPTPKSLHVMYKIRGSRQSVTLKLETNTEFGVMKNPFAPLTEQGKEELVDGYAFDPDVEDYAETDPSIPVAKFAYVYVPYASLRRLYPVRGTAENLLIGTKFADQNLLEACGSFRLFRRTGYTTLSEYININTEFILSLTKSKKTQVTIQGYQEMNYQDFMRFMAPSKYENEEIVIEGTRTTKTEVSDNYMMRMKIPTIENYFGILSEASMREKIQKVEESSRLAEESKIQIAPEVLELREKIKEAVMKVKGVVEEKVVETDYTISEISEEMGEDFNLEESLRKIDLGKVENFISSDTIESIDRVTVAQRILNQVPKKIRFENPIDVLTDVNTRAELETLFPGYIDKLIGKEVFLTKKTKIKRIRMAELCIKTMPNYMKAKYQRLLMLCKLVLKTIPEVSDTRREDLRFASIFEDLFMLDEEGSDEELLPLYSLLPDTDEVEMELDLTKIF